MNRSAKSNNELAHRATWRYVPVLAALIAIGAALAAESVVKAQLPQSSQQPASHRRARANPNPKWSGRIPAASRATSPRTSPPCMPPAPCVWRARIATAETRALASRPAPRLLRRNTRRQKIARIRNRATLNLLAAPLIRFALTRAGCAKITITFASSIPAICASRRKRAAGPGATPRKCATFQPA